jgi:hypothetical protein
MARYISRAPKKPKRSKVIIFLNVLIGILTAAVIITAVGYWSSNRNSYYDRKFGDSTTHYNVERGEYSELVYDYNYDGGSIGMVNKGYEDLAAVAEYADAAFRNSAYEKAGDAEAAKIQRERMEKAASEAGIYSPELSKIDSLLSR